MDAGRAVAGTVANHLDDPDKRHAPVHDRRRTAQDLDPLDVVQAHGRHLRVEHAAPRDAVDDQQIRVLLPEPPHLGDGRGRPTVSAGGDVDSGHERQGGPEVGRAAVSQVLPGNDGHRLRDLVGVVRVLGRGDLDPFFGTRRRDGRLSVGGPNDGSPQHQDNHQRGHRFAHELPPFRRSTTEDRGERDLLPEVVVRAGSRAAEPMATIE